MDVGLLLDLLTPDAPASVPGPCPSVPPSVTPSTHRNAVLTHMKWPVPTSNMTGPNRNLQPPTLPNLKPLMVSPSRPPNATFPGILLMSHVYVCEQAL